MVEKNGLPRCRKDISGLRFGRLVVVKYVEPHKTDGQMWSCVCDCGETAIVNSRHLRKGRTISCGCFRKEATSKRFRSKVHSGPQEALIVGNFKAEYDAYQSAIQRCQNPRHKDYKNYGGRGISVFDDWQNGRAGMTGFECFMAEIGPKPNPNLSIDRIDNERGYEPGNVRWATSKQQAQNRRPRAR